MSSDIIVLSDDEEDAQNPSKSLPTAPKSPRKNGDHSTIIDFDKISLLSSLQLQPVSKIGSKTNANKSRDTVIKKTVHKKVIKRRSKKVHNKSDSVDMCIVVSDDEEKSSNAAFRDQIDIGNLLSITKVESNDFMLPTNTVREECISLNALDDVVFESDSLSAGGTNSPLKTKDKEQDASSDYTEKEEEMEMPRKKIKLTKVHSDNNNDDVIVLDDEDSNADDEQQREETIVEHLSDNTADNERENSLPTSWNVSIMSDCKELFNKFIELCLEKTEDKHKEAMQNKITDVKKMFDKLGDIKEKYVTEIRDFIIEKTELINSDQSKVLLSFKDLFFYLKAIYSENNIDKETRKKIKKLEKTLAIIRARIRRLENVEVNFEDDDNSSYIQLQRYRERAVKVFNKMCQLQKRDPNESRVTYTKLDLYISKYDQINKSINKKYKNNQFFPSFYELDQFIRKCVDKHKLEIPEFELQFEIKKCFEALGKKLKRRRQKELFEVHKDFVDEFESDPIAGDEEKLKIIQKNKLAADEKLQEIFHTFAVKQEKGEEPELSVDSDDSVHNSDISDTET